MVGGRGCMSGMANFWNCLGKREREAVPPLQPSPREQLLWAFHSTELLQFWAARTVCSLFWKNEERLCAREF